ncbi:MAG: 50S ribosomal protein L24 [Clostridia bacterium]|nr:50S ribosomal protein L24 [Clostridia bacterium]
MHVRSKDQVVVISGKDKGKKGKVLTAYPKAGKVVVEGVAMVTKHQKARAQGQQGGIIHKEAAIDASNVMLVCPKCNTATRVAHKVTVVDGNRKMVRVCKKCKADID